MQRLLEFLKSWTAARLYVAGLVLAVAVLAVWWGGLNQDEGWYLYAAQQVRAGRLPYRDFFFTQGPALPFVYSVLAPVWMNPASPLQGLVGGRVITWCWGILAALLGAALVRRLVEPERRAAAGLAFFALLAGNLYHVYFNAIPKTYALGTTFLLGGFLLLTFGLEGRGLRRGLAVAAAGMALALASGTRISLVLALPVTGFALLFRFRAWRWSFLWFGFGGAAGLMLTYGFFALNPVSLQGLLAAQAYHAARGGFDPFFALGSVSRLARGYAALGVVLFAALALRGARRDVTPQPAAVRDVTAIVLATFAAVFLLQLSAPFPYDDYQVPLMALLATAIVPFYYRRARSLWFPLLAAGLMSFCSPLLQEWTTFAPDRFWSRRKPCTELARLREMAREIELFDPGGKMLLTQDLYLAVECGREVPPGFEMGPFSYFPDLAPERARATHVMCREDLQRLLAAAPCRMAACSGYSFAIAAPVCGEVPFAEQKELWTILREGYDLVDSVPEFGQNATTLLVLRRKGDIVK